jgi:hypothetical protein
VERILQSVRRFERIRPIENELLKINPLFRNPMRLCLPMTGLVPFLVPARTKKMAGMGAFFGAVAACLDILVLACRKAGRSGAGPASCLAGLNGSASGCCTMRGTQDMGEKYISPESPGVLRPSGGKFLLLPLNCALGASFAFFADPQGSAKGHWFNNENDKQAVPMQPICLYAFWTNDSGSSGSILTTNRSAQTNLDEPIFT